MISTITATQKFSAIHPIIRVNATELYVYRLRNQNDLDKFIEEVSASIDKKTLLKIYRECTKAPYSFLYVKLTAKTIEDMFFLQSYQTGHIRIKEKQTPKYKNEWFLKS